MYLKVYKCKDSIKGSCAHGNTVSDFYTYPYPKWNLLGTVPVFFVDVVNLLVLAWMLGRNPRRSHAVGFVICGTWVRCLCFLFGIFYRHWDVCNTIALQTTWRSVLVRGVFFWSSLPKWIFMRVIFHWGLSSVAIVFLSCAAWRVQKARTHHIAHLCVQAFTLPIPREEQRKGPRL